MQRSPAPARTASGRSGATPQPGMEAATAEQATAETRAPADEHTERLDPRVVQLRRVSGAVFTAILGFASLAALVVSLVAAGPTTGGALGRAALWVTGVALLAWHMYRWPAIEYRHTSYRLDDLGLEIRRGVFWRTIIYVPRSRIQHTDVSQGPLERRYGLATLVVYTAGTDYARVSLPGLEHATALRIRERLLPTGESGAV